MVNIRKRRLYLLILILIIIPAGFYSKFYNGSYHIWVNNSLGGALYEIFWCMMICFIFPKAKAIIIALTVLFVTCSLEIIQLWHPPFLEYLRSYFIGRTILGVSFNWFDFPYYFAGSLVGWLIIYRIQKKSG